MKSYRLLSRVFCRVALGIFLIVILSQVVDASFFMNSLRRSATDADIAAKSIFPLNNCTAFFVSNRAGKAIVVTAQHCIGWNRRTQEGYRFDPGITKRWCESQKFFDPNIQQERSCIRLIYAEPDSDLLIFEASGPLPSHTLKINASTPPLMTRLQALGFPSDPHRKAGVNISENCWITHLEGDPEAIPERVRFERDHHFAHNCSVYGGNSGGPLVIENTNEVIALPSSFTRNDFENRDARTGRRAQATALSLASFVAQNPAIVRNEKIELATRITVSDRFAPSIPLVSGYYTCEGIPGWAILVQARYNTDDKLREIMWWWREIGANEFKWETKADCEEYEPRKIRCLERNNSKTYVLFDAAHDKFVLQSPNNQSLHPCKLVNARLF